MSPSALQPARAVADLRELAALTEDERGAQRLAFTPTWAAARAFLTGRLEALPVEIEVDEVGNLWATLRGETGDSLVIGGHLDSVLDGGWLDGTLNLMAGLEVMRRLAGEGTPPVTVRLVDWADEEGVRFGGRSMFGSGVATGALDAAAMADLRDRDGVTLSEAVGAFGIDLSAAGQARRQLDSARAYLELHIEQGPRLEQQGLPLAAVTGTVGIERHRVFVSGQAAHAGATPMLARSDAFAAVARMALEIRRIATEADGFGTTGDVRVQPGLPTVVAGQAEISVDLRHVDQEILQGMLADARAASAEIAGEERVRLEWEPVWSVPVTPFDRRLVGLARSAIEEVAGTASEMPSATLHDAARIALAGIPTVMIFVQSLRGLSHCKEEDTKVEDLELAVAALDRTTGRAIDALLSWAR